MISTVGKRFSFNDGIDFKKEGWDSLLFSCSSLGYIMSDPRGKSNMQMWTEAKETWERKKKEFLDFDDAGKGDTYKAKQAKAAMDKAKKKIEKYEPVKDVPNLSDKCKTHLADLYTVYTTGRTEDIITKYMEKGTMIEEDIITNYSILKQRFFKKNIVRKYNGFIEGEMDFQDEDEDMILDAKGNWTIFQFNRARAKPISPLYHWQLEGYMWLWEKSKARLVYGLVNTPEKLIELEKKKLMYNFIGIAEEYEEACKELEYLHRYDDIPLSEKIAIFDVQRNEERVAAIEQRIRDCRYYLNNFNNANKLFEEDETED